MVYRYKITRSIGRADEKMASESSVYVWIINVSQKHNLVEKNIKYGKSVDMC